jgi:hypothetical protein
VVPAATGPAGTFSRAGPNRESSPPRSPPTVLLLPTRRRIPLPPLDSTPNKYLARALSLSPLRLHVSPSFPALRAFCSLFLHLLRCFLSLTFVGFLHSPSFRFPATASYYIHHSPLHFLVVVAYKTDTADTESPCSYLHPDRLLVYPESACSHHSRYQLQPRIDYFFHPVSR